MHKDINGFNKIRQSFKKGFTCLSQESLGDCLNIFYEQKFKSGKDKDAKINYHDPVSGKNSYFEPDWLSKNLKLIFEYDGPDHYNNVWKIERDRRKKIRLNIECKNYKIITIPFYLQITKDLAKKIFKNYYSDQKYLKVIKKLYGANNESEILAPGWHRTHNTIANFVEHGIDRFLEEMDKYPSSLKSQVKHSLDLFIKDSNGKDNLIIPKHHEAFNEFMQFKPDKKVLNLVYLREYKKNNTN